MTLKQVNQFATTEPEKLSRQMSTFEDNVRAECDSIRSDFVEIPARAKLIASATRGTITGIFGQQITVDTSLAAGIVLLPPLSTKNFGKRITVIRTSASNTLKAACQRPGDTIALSTFPQLLAAGVTEILCDDSGYWLK